jgi:two-component system sensor histidine kinase UhpB
MKRLDEELERRIHERTEQLEATNEKLRADIAERKKREAELKRISRALRLVSGSNATLVHLADEATVLNEICRLAVEVCGYKMAWVGFAERDERKTVRPVAHAGFEEGYLESITISWGEGPYGHTIAGTVARTGHPYVARKFPGDEDFVPWRNAVIQRGYRSAVCLPLRSPERTFGVLCIYAAEEDAFDEGELNVLMELANDLAFGLTILRARAERKRTEEELRVSEAKFRALSENAPAAIFIYQGNKIRYANPEMEVISGYSRQELLEMNFWDTVHPDFRDAVRERGLARLRGEPLPTRYEFKIVTKGGEERWVDFTDGIFELDGKPAVIGMSWDITERKRAEGALKTTSEQLRALTAKIESVREEEDRRIGREIHDEIGSAMTGLKWDLEGLDKLCSETSGQIDCSLLRERIKGMVALIDTTSRAVQKISSELRPAILDDLGLIPAVESQAQEFSARTGIVCQFDSLVESIDLDREKATAVFRIIQEALTNILRHSRATRVNIIIEKDDDELIVEIKDNGRGITEAEKARPSSLGLIGMQERTRLIKGKIEIIGFPGKGTALTLRVPFPTKILG